jgi:hypothetical protein
MSRTSSRMLHTVRGPFRLAEVPRERTTPSSALIPINIGFASSRKHIFVNSQTALLSARGVRGTPLRCRKLGSKAGRETSESNRPLPKTSRGTSVPANMRARNRRVGKIPTNR